MLRLADVEPLIVGGLVGVVEGVGHVGAGLRVVGAELLGAKADGAAPDGGVVQVHDHLVALAGAQLVHERAEQAGGHHDGGVVVTEGLRGDGGGGVLLGEGTGHAAAGGPAHGIVAGGMGELAELAVAAHLAPDQPRELLVQGLVVESELLQGGGAHVVHEDVGLADHLLRDGQALGILQVERHPVLVGVVQIDGGIFRIGQLAAEAGALGALGIAGEGLDLDDLGAHLGQDADGGRGGHVGAHLDDLDAGERAVTVELLGDCHRSISPFMQVVGRAVRLFASLSSQGKEPLSTDKMKYVCKTDSKLSRKYH